MKILKKKISPDIIELFYIDGDMTSSGKKILKDLIEPTKCTINRDHFIEIGPHLHTMSPWCSNALSILRKCGVNINRIEKTQLIRKTENIIYDPMINTIYQEPIKKFPDVVETPNEPYFVNDIDKFNQEHGLGFDKQDIEYYKRVFNRRLTNVELYDLAQSNSEHSRHWFFKGQLIKNNKMITQSLFDMIKGTQMSKNNSIIAFSDNSSAIEGNIIKTIYPDHRNRYNLRERKYHITFTAETHNFPTGVSPFPGAATGTGGRIRDNQAIGRGGLTIAGTAGYCVGNLDNSDYRDKNIRTLIEASNGASDYGNKYGEPIIQGFCRAYGADIDGQRHEWVKPIMFTGGIGQMDNVHKDKYHPEDGMLIIKLGGPAYRIGVGGGSASSRTHNTKNKEQDLNAVQRGDPEMENRLNRVIRSCIELEDQNPIKSIHDQGAGGTGNVTKEIVYPKGADIDLDKIVKGDLTLSHLELWISEYQEQNTVLIDEKDYHLLDMICQRENLPIANIGTINNSGFMSVGKAFNLPLEPILGDQGLRKTYILETIKPKITPFKRPKDNILDLLIKVFRLPSVGSKRFLTNKVDRSVTGLIAQQQCVGPLHTPLSDYAIIAQSHYGVTGAVTTIGEQPIKGYDPIRMARMSIGEMLTNMVFAKITKMEDIKCSGNWMWPLKFKGEKYALYQACKAMCKLVKEFGFSFDGGKDSLSMIFQDKEKIIKCPRSLVISGYAPCPDIRVKVTPELKKAGNYLLLVSENNYRMGGSSLATVTDQLGEVPDMDPKFWLDTFDKVQKLVADNKIVSGHDRSDGGLITTLCEMAFAGNLGFTISLDTETPLEYLFNEELGLVIEVKAKNLTEIVNTFDNISLLGVVHDKDEINITGVLCEKMTYLRDIWESRSFDLELHQCNPDCVEQERVSMKTRKKIKYRYNKTDIIHNPTIRYKIAIIRDEGSNGDREMASAFHQAGFDVYDICMNDRISLSDFRGIVFVGGFSYSDVFGAASGWYQVIKNDPHWSKEFTDFYNRQDTFSLGVCNGCQLLVKLGWVPKCRLEKNISNRFESRFSHVKIIKNNSIMLRELQDNILGIWIAHGEGRFVGPSNVTIKYVDDDGQPTRSYPFNPNGSDDSAAAICSDNGRHLAMMPHPERCFLDWQWPTKIKCGKYSPWFQMFTQAYKWCTLK